MRKVWNGGPETEDCTWVGDHEDAWEEVEAGEPGVEEDQEHYSPVGDYGDD